MLYKKEVGMDYAMIVVVMENVDDTFIVVVDSVCVLKPLWDVDKDILDLCTSTLLVSLWKDGGCDGCGCDRCGKCDRFKNES